MKILFTLLIFLSVGFVGCVDKAEIEALEKEIEDIKMETKRLREVSAKTRTEYLERKRLSERLESEKAKLYEAQSDLLPIKEYAGKLDEAHASFDEQLDLWRTAHRKSLSGMRISALRKVDGTTIPNVIIQEVGDENLVLTSDGRSITIPIKDLDSKVQEHLVYEAIIN